jgi:2-keto-4-pentenoate hydratase/2-oxohepta-3-ene-1,7-dioic acid hydratase in catechol pathway
MKIICVGRNYVDHIAELKNDRPSAPVIFLKPETAIIKPELPFYFPDFSKDIHHELEIVIKISEKGKNIQEKFAHKYYNEIGLGIDFTARDLQNELKSKGLPWELAKSFDGSAPISNFYPKDKFKDLGNLNFKLEVNGETRQEGNSNQMIFSIDYIISFVSSYILLKKGDLIFTGTPKGVAPVAIGDNLKGYLEGEKILDFDVK